MPHFDSMYGQQIRIQDNQIYSKIINSAGEEIKAFIQNNNSLNYEHYLILYYIISTLKISLDKKILIKLIKNFIDKYREDMFQSRYKPFKKSFINSILFLADKQLRIEMEEELNISDPKNNKGKNKNSLTDNILMEENKINMDQEINENINEDFDKEFVKILKTQKSNENKVDSLFDLDLDLKEFVEYNSYENLRLPENIGIEERDINFSLNAFDKFDTLLNSIKNLKYLTNKTFDNNYYLDYYIHTIKVGFIIFSPTNFFKLNKNQKIILFEDFPNHEYLSMKPLSLRPLINLFRNKYNTDIYIINEDILNNKSGDIVLFLKKLNKINK